MRIAKRVLLWGFTLAVMACGGSPTPPPPPMSLSIIHLNDLHAHLEPLSNEALCFDGTATRTDLGGAIRIKGAIERLSADNINTLVLGAGDAVEGTLYSTAYGGQADFALLNYYGIDAMTLGNHEFDQGPARVSDYIAWADFPIVSANIDVSDEPYLAGKIQPYTLKSFGGQQVAVIGLTTPETRNISSPGDHVIFQDVRERVVHTIGLLQGLGINKIIVLSHIGYEEDMELAASVTGIDVIVGGHSHTLLGPREELARFGLTVPEGYDYPTAILNPEGRPVLVVQAWCWGRAVGELNVRFDAAGDITAFSGQPYLVNSTWFKQHNGVTWEQVPPEVEEEILALISGSALLEIFAEDAGAAAILQPFTDAIEEQKQTVVATAAENLPRGDAADSFNSGPGPLVADSMLWKTAAQGVTIAIQPRGGIKTDLFAGDIALGDVLALLPYQSLLYTITLSGAEIKAALEDGIDYQITNNPRSPGNSPWYPYVAGLRLDIDETAAKGFRITRLEHRESLDDDYRTVDLNTTYRIAVTAFVASGGDGYTTFKNLPAERKEDTGFIDADAFCDYLRLLGSVYNPTEERIRVLY